jgi:hypothetical protein
MIEYRGLRVRMYSFMGLHTYSEDFFLLLLRKVHRSFSLLCCVQVDNGNVEKKTSIHRSFSFSIKR